MVRKRLRYWHQGRGRALVYGPRAEVVLTVGRPSPLSRGALAAEALWTILAHHKKHYPEQAMFETTPQGPSLWFD